MISCERKFVFKLKLDKEFGKGLFQLGLTSMSLKGNKNKTLIINLSYFFIVIDITNKDNKQRYQYLLLLNMRMLKYKHNVMCTSAYANRNNFKQA